MESIFGQTKEVEHLSSGVEVDLPRFLSKGEGGDPDRDEPVLAERKSKIWMRDDVKRKFAISPTMDELGGWGSTQRESAENEWASIEGEFLMSVRTLLPDEQNRFHLLHAPFRYADGGQNGVRKSPDRNWAGIGDQFRFLKARRDGVRKMCQKCIKLR